MEEINKSEKALLYEINNKLDKIINLVEKVNNQIDNVRYLYETVKFPLNWVFQKIERSPRSVINDQD